MKSFEFLCLYCINAFQGERTSSAIYHLFKGKKSSQTIQDANLFSLSFLFGLFPDLSRDSIEHTVSHLKEQKLVSFSGEGFYIITVKGKSILQETKPLYVFSPSLNGWLYHNKSNVFWKRYSLLVQTLSNLCQHRTDFIPVHYEENVQRYIKQYLLNQRISKKNLAKEIYNETFQLLKMVSKNQALVFVSQLSGYQHAGATIHQISKQLSIDIPWTKLEFQTVLHFILQELEANSSTYPYLSKICKDFLKRPHLTETTQKSLRLLERGISLSEIARIRRIKESTVEDHIVEIALHVKDFSITPYVEEENFKLIQTALEQLGTHQLRRIKKHVANKDISYFQIRLVLTKMGDRHESRQSIKA